MAIKNIRFFFPFSSSFTTINPTFRISSKYQEIANKIKTNQVSGTPNNTDKQQNHKKNTIQTNITTIQKKSTMKHNKDSLIQAVKTSNI